MHELDRVCQFVMGLPTWAKRKLEEKWKASQMWGEVKNPGSRRTTSSLTKSQGMTANGTVGKEAQQRISPNNSKARGSNQKGAL
jgi:hypothetical protein